MRVAEGSRGFAFYVVPDGEYELRARRGALQEDSAASPARRVTVKGPDVTGIELTLAPLASLSGRLVIEAPPAGDRRTKCENKRRALLEETVIILRRDEQAAHGDQFTSLCSLFSETTPSGYWLLALPAAEGESGGAMARPAALDDEPRASRRREAEASNVVLDLLPSQSLVDYALRYTPPNK